MTSTATSTNLRWKNPTCRKCGTSASVGDRYCTHCGRPLKMSARVKQLTKDALFFIRAVLISASIILVALIAMAKIGYYMPSAVEAREAIIPLSVSFTGTANDSAASSGFESQLMSHIEFAAEITDRKKNHITATVSKYLPPSVDKLLFERGWRIVMVENDALPSGVMGRCDRISRTIEVESDTTSPIHTIFHEIGHAVDIECGLPSLTTDFVLEACEEDEWTPHLRAAMRETHADIHPMQRFAQAFANYALYSNDREGAERLYEWFDNNIF